MGGLGHGLAGLMMVRTEAGLAVGSASAIRNHSASASGMMPSRSAIFKHVARGGDRDRGSHALPRQQGGDPAVLIDDEGWAADQPQRVRQPFGDGDLTGIAGRLDVLLQCQTVEGAEFRDGNLHGPVAAGFAAFFLRYCPGG